LLGRNIFKFLECFFNCGLILVHESLSTAQALDLLHDRIEIPLFAGLKRVRVGM